MSVNKIYVSHSDSSKSAKMYEKVKNILNEIKKDYEHYGPKEKYNILTKKEFDKLEDVIKSCEVSIFILTADLLKSNREDLSSKGIMFKEIQKSLEFGVTQFINGVILVVDEEFRNEYFKMSNKMHFPILDKNMDNVNSILKSDSDSFDYLLVVKEQDFYDNPTKYIHQVELMRLKQMSKRLYDIRIDF